MRKDHRVEKLLRSVATLAHEAKLLTKAVETRESLVECARNFDILEVEIAHVRKAAEEAFCAEQVRTVRLGLESVFLPNGFAIFTDIANMILARAQHIAADRAGTSTTDKEIQA